MGDRDRDEIPRDCPCIVLFPMKSTFREKIPREADGCLAQALREAYAGDRPNLIDLSAAMPDELFSDFIHLDWRGKEALTRRLSGELERRLHGR